MSDLQLLIGSGERPNGETLTVNGPAKITEFMNPSKPLTKDGIDLFCKRLSEENTHLYWDGNSFVICWQPYHEWPFRQPSAWRDGEALFVNFAEFMKKFGVKPHPKIMGMASQLDDLTLTFADVETTGFKLPPANRIIEISICRVRPGAQPEWFSTLVNPGKKIPPSSTEVHGIRDRDVKNAPRFREISSKVVAILADSVFISHQVGGFDERFICEELADCGIKWQPSARLSTLTLAESFFPNLKSHKLKELANEFQLEVQQSHRAESDVRTMMGLWKKIRQVAAERSPALTTLGDFHKL